METGIDWRMFFVAPRPLPTTGVNLSVCSNRQTELLALLFLGCLFVWTIRVTKKCSCMPMCMSNSILLVKSPLFAFVAQVRKSARE